MADLSFIDSVVVFNRGGGCCQERLRDITVSVLDESLTEVYNSGLLNLENVLGGPASLTLELGSSVIGKFVRVGRTRDDDSSGAGATPGNADAAVLSMGEVQVFGSFVPQYFPFIQTDLLDEMKDVNATALLRIPFDVADPAASARRIGSRN